MQSLFLSPSLPFSLCMCKHACRGQQMVLDHLKLKLSMTASHRTGVLGTEVWFSGNMAKYSTAVPSPQLLSPFNMGTGGI